MGLSIAAAGQSRANARSIVPVRFRDNQVWPARDQRMVPPMAVPTWPLTRTDSVPGAGALQQAVSSVRVWAPHPFNSVASRRNVDSRMILAPMPWGTVREHTIGMNGAVTIVLRRHTGVRRQVMPLKRVVARFFGAAARVAMDRASRKT